MTTTMWKEPAPERSFVHRALQNRLLLGLLLLGVGVLVASSFLTSAYLFTLNAALLACMGAVALNVLMGTAGQVSIGNAAFLGVGGFSAIYFANAGLMFPVDVILAAVFSGVVGIIVGLPALRLSGLYLALATLAAHFLVVFLGTEYQNHEGMPGGFSAEQLFASFDTDQGLRYWSFMLFAILAVVITGASMLMRSKTGRALRIIRDHEPMAPMLGIAITRYKLAIFALASAVIGAQGALTIHLNGFIVVENFTLAVAFSYLAMIIIGGLDSIVGAVLGAFLIISLPVLVPNMLSTVFGAAAEAYSPQISQMIYGVLVLLFIVASPNGIVGFVRAKIGILVRRRTERLDEVVSGDMADVAS